MCAVSCHGERAVPETRAAAVAFTGVDLFHATDTGMVRVRAESAVGREAFPSEFKNLRITAGPASGSAVSLTAGRGSRSENGVWLLDGEVRFLQKLQDGALEIAAEKLSFDPRTHTLLADMPEGRYVSRGHPEDPQ